MTQLDARPASAPRLAPSHDPLLELTATELLAALRAGDVSAESYVERALARAGRLSGLNLFVTLDAERVREQARAADLRRGQGKALPRLHGLPVALKDLINTAGEPTSGATAALAGNLPKAGDAEIVRMLGAAGTIRFGKANMHELSFGATSVNPVTGAVGNPYDPTLIAGGSSGGSGAIVAARVVPAAIGGDTAGSVRIPASLSGVCGLRPTVGRWPGDQRTLVPISRTRDTLGPLARSCADLELLDRVVTGASRVRAADLRKVRLARVGYFWSDLDTRVERAAGGAVAALAAAGVQVVEAELDVPSLTTGSFDLMLFEFVQGLTHYLNANTAGPLGLAELHAQVKSPDVAGLMRSLMPGRGGRRVPESAHRAALEQRQQLRAAYARLFKDTGCDALVFPTTVCPATPIRQPASIEMYIHNTDAGSMAGIPGTAQPIGLADGLPMSLALDGPVNSDRRLLAIAMALETSVFGRLPPPAI